MSATLDYVQLSPYFSAVREAVRLDDIGDNSPKMVSILEKPNFFHVTTLTLDDVVTDVGLSSDEVKSVAAPNFCAWQPELYALVMEVAVRIIASLDRHDFDSGRR